MLARILSAVDSAAMPTEALASILVRPGVCSSPGAPYAYGTTPGFLAYFGFETLRDQPDIEKLEDAGLLGRKSEALLAGAALAAELKGELRLTGDEDEVEEDAA